MARRLLFGLVGAALALPLVVALRGFMVDDALITARYAANVAAGHGYRFNPSGAATDGVTPLGFAYLLAPFATGGALAAFRAAKLLGAVAWLLGAGAMAQQIGEMAGSRRRWLALSLLACSAPLAAWAVAGMETGLVLGLAAFAAVAVMREQGRLAAGLAGVVAGLRPEALLWAGVVGWGAGAATRRARGERLLLAAGPFVLVAVLRLIVFGRPAPLAVFAKRSDLQHGALYAAACFLLTGPLAAVAVRGLSRPTRVLQLAVLAQLVAVVLVGGDWMPLSRLVVLALPSVILVAAAVLARGPEGILARALSLGRLGLALAGVIYALVTVGPRAAEVSEKRFAVIDALAPALADAKAIAALDVGWVGVAAPEAAILDLAGVTEPAVAALSGGHTTKRVPDGLLASRGVDTLVLLLADDQPLVEPWPDSHFARFVEHHVAQMSSMARRFEPVAVSPAPLRYVVLRQRRDGT
ncbi:MAG: hypothetical protein R3B72_45785 [Polyangiaceae bacterium]